MSVFARYIKEIPGPLLLKKFPAFYGTRRFITAFTRGSNNLSFVLTPTSLYLTRLGVEGYYSFDHTQRHITVGRTPLDEGSVCRRDIYLTTHDIYNRQTSMPSARFEPAVPSGERLQTHALDRSATGIGAVLIITINIDELSSVQ
jgi:hypothetical protein